MFENRKIKEIDNIMEIVRDHLKNKKPNSHKKGLYDLQRAMRLKRIRLELRK